jgi:hypothetical protein
MKRNKHFTQYWIEPQLQIRNARKKKCGLVHTVVAGLRLMAKAGKMGSPNQATEFHQGARIETSDSTSVGTKDTWHDEAVVDLLMLPITQ